MNKKVKKIYKKYLEKEEYLCIDFAVGFKKTKDWLTKFT